MKIDLRMIEVSRLVIEPGNFLGRFPVPSRFVCLGYKTIGDAASRPSMTDAFDPFAGAESHSKSSPD
ncbi:hypothetical protein [Jiella pacifica]|uniref:Uncharacterized protein n=1 Tax=Jiella pacifica TaxID=2696469 RepID=A0A6N9T4D1_9HYPH|nr:hypothetical protein [Jiella pacifica]NDW06234.1 hypothetical protein [Jiella pacifica]